MCVAYLICRLADTVEDDVTLRFDQRCRLYDALLSSVDDPKDAAKAEAFRKGWPVIPEGDYGRLVEGAVSVMAAFATLPERLRLPIGVCVHDMVAGMRLTRPVKESGGLAFICGDLKDLEQYCHYVAGTVGIMSTALFETRFDRLPFEATDAWREEGRRLGLGLQMTNIIKDCRVDAARGICFLPPNMVSQDPSFCVLREGRIEVVRRCVEHLDAGLRYTLAIPVVESGIRTFLLGSLLPAVATLEVAASAEILHPKISRSRMAEILDCITRYVADNAALKAWYDSQRTAIWAALDVSGGDAPA